MYDSLNINNKQTEDKFMEETEREAIQVIMSQKKKIKILNNDLERKEEEIGLLKSKLVGMENYKIQMENFKRQVSILDEKLHLYEQESNSKNNFYNDQYKQLVESDNKLRSQLINKDKIIKEYDHTIREQEKAMNQLKKQMMEKEALNRELKQEFNEISARFKNLTVKLNNKEEEYLRVCEENENKLKYLEEDKVKTEEKVNELIDIVKQQSKELSELYVQCQMFEKEKKTMIKNFSNLEKEYENCSRANDELKSQFSIIGEFKKKINETDEKMNLLHKELENERDKNNELSNEIGQLSLEYERFKGRVSGDNSPEFLKQLIESKENDIFNLKELIENCKKSNSISENKVKDLENEIREIIMGINIELKTINQWIDTYLGVHFEQHIEIPELPYTISKAIKNKIKFDSLKENLINSQKKMNNELNKNELFINELKNECNEYIKKQESLMNDISALKNHILIKNEEIFVLQQSNDSFNKELSLIKETNKNLKIEMNEKNDIFTKFLQKLNFELLNEVEKIKQNELIVNSFPQLFYKSTYSENIKDQILFSIKTLVEISDHFLQQYDNTLKKIEEHNILKQEMEKFRRENTIKNDSKYTIEESKNDEKLNKIINEQNELINNLNSEILALKSEKSILHHKIDPDNEEKYKILEKKVTKLINDNNLKEMQIKNQEEMLYRRNIEIEDLKGKQLNKKENKGKSVSPDRFVGNTQDFFKTMMNTNKNIFEEKTNHISSLNNSADI